LGGSCFVFGWGKNMKAFNKSLKGVLGTGLLVVFFFGTVGIALKFVTFFDHWVYFPSFPNSLDSAFLISGSLYFIVYIVYNRRHLAKENRKMPSC
jgi:hypothetical protein